MQTNFFSNVPNSDGIQKKMLFNSQKLFSNYMVFYFETIEEEIIAAICKETA